MKERLQKILAQAGVASRRNAEKLIAAGRVAVDGTVVTELGAKVEASDVRITVDGKPLPAQEAHVYFLLNKPKGYITTAHDDRGRRTVLDLLPEVKERIYPVGRLDNNTEGLLLLTNDGALTNGLMHPKQEVDKTYVARVQPAPTEQALVRLTEGVKLEDGMTAPALVRVLSSDGAEARVEITIHEGLKDIQFLQSNASGGGSGIFGVLDKPMKSIDFLQQVKSEFGVECLQHNQLLSRPIHRVAFCGGAGDFLLNKAIAMGAVVK